MCLDVGNMSFLSKIRLDTAAEFRHLELCQFCPRGKFKVYCKGGFLGCHANIIFICVWFANHGICRLLVAT